MANKSRIALYDNDINVTAEIISDANRVYGADKRPWHVRVIAFGSPVLGFALDFKRLAGIRARDG